MIRYFCLVDGSASDGRHYLQTIHELGLAVRVLPIGMLMPEMPAMWEPLRALFATPISDGFVNVVCSSPAVLMGGQQRLVRPGALADGSGPVTYEPPLALCGLYTVGCKNIAILPNIVGLHQRELLALMKYDLVLCQLSGDAAELRDRGIGNAIWAEPTKQHMKPILEGMIGRDDDSKPCGKFPDSETTKPDRVVIKELVHQREWGTAKPSVWERFLRFLGVLRW